MLYGAIYFRTGNLWGGHRPACFAGYGGPRQHRPCTTGVASTSEVVSSYDPSMLVGLLFYLVPALFLLRRSRLPLVAAYWGLEDAQD